MKEFEFDLFGGKLDRDAGMHRTFSRDPKWTQAAMHGIFDLPPGWEGSGQDIRIRLRGAIGEPYHPNVWGSVISNAVRRGYLVRTGKQKHARIRASHARRNDVYRRTA